ncbi:MAG: cupredoxin domain-containing protein [Vicinamibacterales bacterium]
MRRARQLSFLFSLAVIAVAGTALLSGATAVSKARQDPATASAPRVIEIAASRFTFEPSRIEVTEGERVRLVVQSVDSVHGIAIKKFRVNKVVGRKETISVDFVAAAAGTYEILCSEYCGEGHEGMTGTLVVRAKSR